EKGFIPADAEERDKSWLDTYGMVQTILKYYPEYIPNTYLQYYLFPEYKVAHLNSQYTRADEVINGREKRVFEECAKIIARGKVDNSVIARNEAHADMIVDVATSLAYNQNKSFILITKNNGVIQDFHDDAMIECTALVNANGIMPLAVGKLDTFTRGLMEGQYAYEKLTVEASFEKSYLKALQAVTLNRTVVDGIKAKALLDDIMEANKDYWILK
ncbi:MAG: 6-phospho-alpha-glucosidase, partial [Clostridia bacterium]